MTYIISGLGFATVADVTAAAAATVKPVSPGIANGEGTGTAADPFGGIAGNWGGADGAKALTALTKAGVAFSGPPGGKDEQFQEGLFNREKYVYVKGVDAGKTFFYKFKVPGSGMGVDTSDAKAQTWFTNTVLAARAVIAPPPGGFITPSTIPQSKFDPIQEAGIGGGTGVLIFGVAAAIAAAILLKPMLKGRKGSKSTGTGAYD